MHTKHCKKSVLDLAAMDKPVVASFNKLKCLTVHFNGYFVYFKKTCNLHVLIFLMNS